VSPDIGKMTVEEIEHAARRVAVALAMLRSAQNGPTPRQRMTGGMTVTKGLGDRARSLRVDAGHSQQALAKLAGLGIQAVVILETQDKASPRTLEKIGQVLGVKLGGPR